MWLYFPPAEYQQARDAVSRAIESAGCGQVLLAGFSNGAAFAAKLYCQGETFGGRLARLVIDDPVTDAGTANCLPTKTLPITLYWTGKLEEWAPPGWDCVSGDWTCEGGRTVGIQVYSQRLGVPVTASPNRDHTPYSDPPEFRTF